MGKVLLHVSMSLDGFIAGPDVGVERPLGEGGERLHDWMFGGAGDPRDEVVASEMFSTATTGAVVIGRRTFDVGIGEWGDDGAFGLPCFVVTHRPAEPLVKGPTTFTFVTDGIEPALERATAAARDKNVNVMGADLARQFLRAGLLDEILINLVPVLLGGGVRLFEDLGADPVDLERTSLIATPGVTHVRFRLVR